MVTSGLHRNSAYLERRAALASQSDASGMSDKHPVLAQHAEPEASIDRERFTGASASLPERHTFSWKGPEKARSSLFSKEKCLSLRRRILFQRPKSGKDAALPPLAEAQRYPRRSVMKPDSD